MVATAVETREILKSKGIKVTLVNSRFVKPIDTDVIDRLSSRHNIFVPMEENVASGGYGEKIIEYVKEKGISAKVLPISIPDEYVEHGSVDQLKKEIGIDAQSIADRILIALKKK